ncbi:MAG TPA: ROK family protein [Tepidisphaeraceae bacterium]
MKSRAEASGANMANEYAIGIDLGGTNVKAICVDESGKILEHAQFPTTDDAAGTFAGEIRAEVEKLEVRHGRARWIGVSSPGFARPDGKSIYWMAGRMEAVQGLEWTKVFARDHLVPVINDANAALLGEVWQGAARGAQDAILLTLGTGVGGAVLANGKLLKGHLGRAGHLGHMTVDFNGKPDIVGTPGSIEEFIGNYTVGERCNGRFTTTRDLVDAYQRGDPDAARVWMRSVRALASHLVSLINAVDPEVVILGGGVALAGEALFSPLGQFLDEFEWRPHGHKVKIVAAQLGEVAGAVGAAWNAMREA